VFIFLSLPMNCKSRFKFNFVLRNNMMQLFFFLNNIKQNKNKTKKKKKNIVRSSPVECAIESTVTETENRKTERKFFPTNLKSKQNIKQINISIPPNLNRTLSLMCGQKSIPRGVGAKKAHGIMEVAGQRDPRQVEISPEEAAAAVEIVCEPAHSSVGLLGIRNDDRLS
jgi:hypothetical protein